MFDRAIDTVAIGFVVVVGIVCCTVLSPIILLFWVVGRLFRRVYPE